MFIVGFSVRHRGKERWGKGGGRVIRDLLCKYHWLVDGLHMSLDISCAQESGSCGCGGAVWEEADKASTRKMS